MKPRISVITLGVADLDRSVGFYRDGLGLSTNGIVGREFENGAVAFSDLQGGLKLALWPRASMENDTGLVRNETHGASITLGHNVRTRENVDIAMAEAKKAGAEILKPATDTFWGGYAGYFRDPDGYVWEVVWNPQLMPEE